MKTSTKVISIIVAILLVVAAIFCYFKFFFVLGEGVKAGELNRLVYKGWVFKTYEGRLIQAGFRGSKQGSIQSNEFNFSVVDKAVADSLMRCSGKMVELKYREYNGILPWRGMERFVVYEILSIDSGRYSSEVPIFSSGEEI